MPFFMAESQERADAAPGSIQSLRPVRAEGLRAQTCPPELFTRSRPAWRRWVRRMAMRCRDALGWASHPAAPAVRVEVAREHFFLAVADLHSDAVDGLRDRIARARSLRELWHLRLEVFQLLSCARGQPHAQRQMDEINAHFPMRIPATPAASGAPRVTQW